MDRKRQIILFISMRAGDHPTTNIFKMSEKDCDDYLKNKYISLTPKQKEVAGSGALEDWYKIVGLTDEKCENFNQKRTEEETVAQKIVNDAVNLLCSP